MEHYEATSQMGLNIFAWRSPGGSRIQYRTRLGSDWSDTESILLTTAEKAMSVPALMHQDWYLGTEPVPAS